MIKRALVLICLLAFGTVVIGCSANGKVSGNDDHGTHAKVDVDTH